jgi:hypothetical protein
MKIYYGKNKTRGYGFYHDTVHTPAQIPADAVEITQAQHAELMAAYKIEVGPDGTPKAVAFSVAALPLPQQAGFVMSQGIEITSASCPAIDGTYECTGKAVTELMNAAIYLNTFGEFPGAAGETVHPVLEWPDKSGKMHRFAGPALFLAFARAVMNYNALLKQVVYKASTTMPPASVRLD